MPAAPNRQNESESLKALLDLGILDSAPEAEFEALVRVASIVCGAPISLISLIDADRQWFKANIGLPGVPETPRDAAFCAHAVLGEDILEIADATQDPRFADNPLVLGHPDIRFYAGAPVRLSDGSRIGTLCVIDRRPRRLTEVQRDVLRALSIAVARAMEGRLAAKKLQDATQALALREKDLRLVVNSVPSMIAYWTADLVCRFANQAYEHWFGVRPEGIVGHTIQDLLGPELFALNKPYLDAALIGETQTFERIVPGPNGIRRHSLAHYVPDVAHGEVVGILVQVTDITPLKAVEEALRAEVTERDRINRALQGVTETLREAQRLGHIGSWEWQAKGDLISWSEELFHIFGRDPGCGPLTFAEQLLLYTPESRARLEAAIDAIRQSANEYVLELEFIRPDGSRRWIEGRGEPIRDVSGLYIGSRGTAQDITERLHLVHELAHQNELTRVTLQSIGDAVITTDAGGIVTWLNPVAERLTGWLNAEAKGRPLGQVFYIINEKTRELAECPVMAALAQRKTTGLAHHTLLLSRDGSEYGIEDSAAPIRSEAGVILGAVLVFHDVSEQRRLSSEMTYRATHDILTGLVNRSEFESRLQRALHKVHADQSKHVLLYLDLDQFKLINDACGHAVGDQLLQQVAKLMSDSVRTRDTLARLGGDEFAMILEHCSAEQALAVAQKICDRMDEFRFIHEGRRFRVGTSIGLVAIDSNWSSVTQLYQAADAACYAAKEAGRNRVHAWFESDTAMLARRGETQWAARIEHALDHDEFVLFAQCIQHLQGEAGGLHAEVLLRMNNPDGSLTLPGAFLPAAERFHLVSRIDRWVVGHVLTWIKTLPSAASMDCVSINLSGKSVGDRAFHAWVYEQLVVAGPLACSKVCFEITETAAVTNISDATLFVDRVRAMGTKVALDDFGAGASSFGYLKNFAVDFLKIDGQFIQHLVSDPLNDVAVRCFTDVAKVLGVKTVAEFVDRAEVLERIQEIGVDFAQGFFIHRPRRLEELLVGNAS